MIQEYFECLCLTHVCRRAFIAEITKNFTEWNWIGFWNAERFQMNFNYGWEDLLRIYMKNIY